MRRATICGIALAVLLACCLPALASQSTPDTLTSLVNPCFATSWSSSCAAPPANSPSGWYIVEPTSGIAWCLNYITTGDNCSTGRYSDHRLKMDQLKNSYNTNFVLGKEINWGSYTQATVTVKAAGHYWTSGGAGQGKVALGCANGHGTAWSQCGSNVHELVNPSECAWNTLTVVYNKGASSTFTVMLRGMATAGGFNCQFDQLTVSGTGGGCTPPATPGAPTVNGATATTLNVANNAGDSGTAYFAIRINGGAYTNQYVQANGSVGASAVWQTKATWGTKTVTGLACNTTYAFDLKAANDASGTCPTSFGTATQGTTSCCAPATPGTPTVNGATCTTLNVANNAGDSSSAYFAIRINGGAYTNEYVQANGTVGATAVWQTKATWGTKTVTGLTGATTYTFDMAAATNSSGACPSSFGTSAVGNTAVNAATPGAPIVNGATPATVNVAINSGDSSSAYFAIRINGGSYTNQYVQANGSVGASAVWQTKATWGTKTVTGLAQNTTYTFDVRAANDASGGCQSEFWGPPTQGTTRAYVSSVLYNQVNSVPSTNGNLSRGQRFKPTTAWPTALSSTDVFDQAGFRLIMAGSTESVTYTMRLFTWNTNYATTINGTPIASVTGVTKSGVTDQWQTLTFAPRSANAEYLLEIKSTAYTQGNGTGWALYRDYPGPWSQPATNEAYQFTTGTTPTFKNDRQFNIQLRSYSNCTVPATPGTPTVSGATSTTLNVANNAGDSGSAYFAIRINGGSYTNQFVQANGSVGANAVWQTKATWGTKTVTGLAPSTTYAFDIRAANDSSGSCPSSYGAAGQGTTTVGTTGTLTGTVRTATMSVIDGVSVTTTPATSTVTTNASGVYTIPAVPSGQTYTITYSKSGFQTSNWYNVTVGSGQTVTVPDKLMPRSWSKIGAHVVLGRRDGWGSFLTSTYNAGKWCQFVKCLDDFGAAYTAKFGNTQEGVPANPNVLTMGRFNDTPHYDMQGFDPYADPSSPNYTAPATFAQIIYDEITVNHRYDNPPLSILDHPEIDVWEICNEWSYWWAWQADFYIAMMDIMEAHGQRLAMFGCSGGNPPTSSWPDFARCCARAKAHGGHMLSLHEYCWDGTIQSCYQAAPGEVITRYRSLYDYLRANNADCPLAITEAGNNGGGGFIGDNPFVADMGFYDNLCRQDDYNFGIASWTLGQWSGANWYTALPEMATYICNH